MSDRQTEVSKISDEVNTMLTRAPSGSLQELARSLMRLNSLWEDVNQRVHRYASLYDTAELQWREFRGTYSSSSVFDVMVALTTSSLP